jgi:hypothetical protein
LRETKVEKDEELASSMVRRHEQHAPMQQPYCLRQLDEDVVLIVVDKLKERRT